MPEPLISIIMPCFNGEKYIESAINSILAQSYVPIELIIIDDGSTDNSKEVIQSFGDKVQYYYQPNGGPSKARNLGVKIAKGDYIGFLDADDLMNENMLAKCISIFGEYPETEIVWTKYQIVYEANVPRYGIRIGEDNTIHTTYLGSALYRRKVFDKIGLLDEQLRFSEDTDWWKRAMEAKLNVQKIEFIGIIYRRHQNNLTNNPESVSARNLMSLLHNSIKRKRSEK